ncbi:hypothetical protein AXG93_154s1110 [Marchantia polymorpha subsp. ruderalis]|uniref:AtPDCT1/2 transmembrane domain-containing protein n=1 Tax=Marchantia polymorpha subsp. ruderalis TaxID=1480154 RepID=A0A176VJ87_MARPO|nr:hypothetical protein AXG93_154s1110 [Marchantia polymorpha subsp. ruderalis]
MLRYVQVGQFLSSVIPALWLRAFRKVLWDAHTHPLIPLLGCNLLLMMKLEYTLQMVGPGKQPFDVGFQYTATFHDYLKERPLLNTVTAALNTPLAVREIEQLFLRVHAAAALVTKDVVAFIGSQAFVFFQVVYVAYAWIVEGRKRATLAALLLYTCRGLMGYSTQLPLPQEFLGSELDFPVGNVSFFLFFSGHIGGSVIASLDLRRAQRRRLGAIVDFLNLLQWFRLLATRGHYTIDLIVGAGAGWACDHLAGKYEERKAKLAKLKEFGPDNRLQGVRISSYCALGRPTRCSLQEEYSTPGPKADNDLFLKASRFWGRKRAKASPGDKQNDTRKCSASRLARQGQIVRPGAVAF